MSKFESKARELYGITLIEAERAGMIRPGETWSNIKRTYVRDGWEPSNIKIKFRTKLEALAAYREEEKRREQERIAMANSIQWADLPAFIRQELPESGSTEKHWERALRAMRQTVFNPEIEALGDERIEAIYAHLKERLFNARLKTRPVIK